MPDNEAIANTETTGDDDAAARARAKASTEAKKEKKKRKSNKRIEIRVGDQHQTPGEVLHFEIKKTIQMPSVFIQYAEIKGVPISSLRFVLNGKRINGAQTADGLELNDQDVIDCFSMRSFLPNDYCPLINALTHCANCNKETEPFMLKMCTSCRFAHYCNDDCQQMHHKEHIQQCKQHAQDLKKQVDAIATNRRRGKKRKDKNDDADKDDIQESKTEDHSSKNIGSPTTATMMMMMMMTYQKTNGNVVIKKGTATKSMTNFSPFSRKRIVPSVKFLFP
mmetsp:Transcript_37339/g.37804  ORF Transcript_37339/g.37804 Transcript_37339/m.37804 type:complete len:279 (-) Transcript_37339:776-1612(-)